MDGSGRRRKVVQLELRRSWCEAPAVATLQALRLCAFFFYFVGGVLQLFGAAFLQVPHDAREELTLIGLASLAISLIVLGWGALMPRWCYPVVHLAGTGLIALSVVLAGGGAASVSLTAPFLFGVVAAALLFSIRAALLLIASVEGVCSLAMLWAGASAGDLIVVQGCTVAMAFVVGWVGRLADGIEQDPLTGLLNRRGFDRLVEEALRQADRHGRQIALAVLDVDDFKAVNDLGGHAEGDRRLVACANAWSEQLPDELALCRYGGDEFVLLMPAIPLGVAADIADLLRMTAPGVAVSAGVAAWRPGDSPSTLLGRADVALYDAKTSGRDRTVVHGDPTRAASELEAAIANGEFEVHLQPIVQLSTEAVIGYEALARWRHPRRGLLLPEHFIPEAERTGAIVSLGRWMLAEACRIARTAPGPPRSIGVNAAAAELRSEEYAACVRRLLARWGLPGNMIVVEVTEGAFDDDPRVLETLCDLRELGVLVAIDDFGAGYSSLRRLEELPIDLIKLDGALVTAIRPDRHDAPILEAIATMGRSLDVRLVAEHVETQHQADVLRRLGYDLAQGYHFGRPVPAAGAPR